MINKIISDKTGFYDFINQNKNTRIALCKGHFNVIHPGHLRFLKNAKEHGDKLVVAVMSDAELAEKRYSGNYFSMHDRAEGLSNLNCVDTIILLNGLKLEDIINNLPPLTLIMGKEFEVERRPEVDTAIKLVKKKSGKIVFHSGGYSYSSKQLFEDSTFSLEHERWNTFLNICNDHNITYPSLFESLNLLNKVKILVIGDTIVDQFIACDAIGMSAEAPVIVLKELEAKQFVGGAAIVAAHSSSLGAQCKYVSVTGNDDPAEFLKKELTAKNVDSFLYTDSERPTTFKIRYIVENQKMFRVSRLEEQTIPHRLEKKIIRDLQKLIPESDGIIISDFVYGMITPAILETIIDTAKSNNVKLFGDLQCSSQIGNICKFRNFDLLTPTEREARISLGDQDSGLEKLAMRLLHETSVKNLIISLGSNGFIAYCKKDNDIISQHFPALCCNPVDSAGAGDTLLTTVSLSLCAGIDFVTSVALGACASAITVSRIGNIPISVNDIKNYLNSKKSNTGNKNEI